METVTKCRPTRPEVSALHCGGLRPGRACCWHPVTLVAAMAALAALEMAVWKSALVSPSFNAVIPNKLVAGVMALSLPYGALVAALRLLTAAPGHG